MEFEGRLAGIDPEEVFFPRLQSGQADIMVASGGIRIPGFLSAFLVFTPGQLAAHTI